MNKDTKCGYCGSSYGQSIPNLDDNYIIHYCENNHVMYITPTTSNTDILKAIEAVKDLLQKKE